MGRGVMLLAPAPPHAAAGPLLALGALAAVFAAAAAASRRSVYGASKPQLAPLPLGAVCCSLAPLKRVVWPAPPPKLHALQLAGDVRRPGRGAVDGRGTEGGFGVAICADGGRLPAHGDACGGGAVSAPASASAGGPSP